MGRAVECCMRTQKRKNYNNTTTLYEHHFNETEYTFVNLVINLEIIRTERKLMGKTLRGALEILKQKKKVNSKLLNTKISF